MCRWHTHLDQDLDASAVAREQAVEFQAHEAAADERLGLGDARPIAPVNALQDA
jgi:hypothetical protein